MSKNILVSAVPPYFSWVIDGLLAVSAFPYHHTHLRYLSENRIHTVVSMSPEEEPPFHTKPELKIVKLGYLLSKNIKLSSIKYFWGEHFKRRLM